MRKLSPAEAGKLGAEKSKLITAQRMIEKISLYELSPNKCKQCLNHLSYKARHNLFCGRSCAAKLNNSKRENKVCKKNFTNKNILGTKVIDGATRVEWSCLNCNKINLTKPSQPGIYCNNKCQNSYAYKIKIDNWLTFNEPIGKNTIKRYLQETYGYKCSVCKIENWLGKSITLELEHKDGNSENNNLENLCLLCPNCHSQTPTFKGKNKGKGRHSRMVRYHQGKSF